MRGERSTHCACRRSGHSAKRKVRGKRRPKSPQHGPGDRQRCRQGLRDEVRARMGAHGHRKAGVGRTREDERPEIHRLGRRQPLGPLAEEGADGCPHPASAGAAARRRTTPRIASGGTVLPLRRISIRPSRARPAAARRTGAIKGRQGPSSPPARARATSLGQMERSRPRASVKRRISARIAVSAGKTTGWFIADHGSAGPLAAQAARRIAVYNTLRNPIESLCDTRSKRGTQPGSITTGRSRNAMASPPFSVRKRFY